MLSGREFSTPRYEFRVSVSGSATAGPTAPAGVTASLTSRYHDDYLLTLRGFKMTVSLQFDPINGDSSGATLEGVVGFQTRTYPGTASSIEATLTFFDFKIYELPSGSFRITFSSAEWRVNGNLEHTIGASTITSPLASVPGAVPIIGILPLLESGAIVPLFPSLEPGGGVGSGAGSYSGSGTANAGWRFRDELDSEWLSQPIALNAPGSAGTPGAPSGTSCASVTMNFETSADSNGIDLAVNEITGGNCWLWPNSPCEVVRMNDDYEAEIYRGSLGAWQYRKIDVKTTRQRFIPPPPTPELEIIDDSVIGNMRAAASEFLETVGNDTAVVEGPLQGTRYAPWLAGKTTETITNSYKETIQDAYDGMHSVGAGNLLAFGHLEKFVRLWNGWFHPHWHYGLWFPPDTAPDSVRWKLDGAPANLEDYWYPVRQQYIDHPSLPTGQRTKRRVDIVAEPAKQNFLAGLALAEVGTVQWWGTGRFFPDLTSWLEQVLLDDRSSDRWSFNGSGSSVSTDRMTFGAAATEAEFEMASFTDWPYMVPTIARRIALGSLNWSNVASVKIEVIDDSVAAPFEVTIVDPATTGGEWAIPSVLSSKWATDLVRNLGPSAEKVDEYDDLAPAADDESFDIASSIRRAATHALSRSKGYARIRITITKTNPAVSATVGLVRLKIAPRSEWQVRYVSGHGATLLSKNGPSLRTNALQYFDYLFDTPLSVPQAVLDQTLAPTIGDCFALRRSFFEARDAQDGMLVEGLSYFENGEEMTIVDHLWRDPEGFIGAHSFWVQGAGGPVPIISNTYRAVPPLAIAPERKRSFDSNWLPTGELGQYSYSLVAKRRNIIAIGDDVDLHLRRPADILTMETDPPEGWTIGFHEIPVDNDEAYDATVVVGGTEYLKMRPWRGAMIFDHLAATNALGVWNLQTRDGRFLVSWAAEDGCYVRWWSYHLPAGDNLVVQIRSGDGFEQCRVYEDHRNRIFALTGRNDSGTLTASRQHSDDGGKTWSTPTDMGITNGRFPTGASSEHGDQIEAAFVHDSGTSGPGTIKIVKRSSGDTAFSSPITVKNASGSSISFDDQSFGILFSHDSASRVILTAVVDGETESSSWWSTDVMSGGCTFKRFT